MNWIWQTLDDIAYKMYWDLECYCSIPMYIIEVFTGAEDTVEIFYSQITTAGTDAMRHSKIIPKHVYNQNLELLQPRKQVLYREIGLKMPPGRTGKVYEYEIHNYHDYPNQH